MVKGTAKQAVILNPGEKSGFEQAIFILAPESDREKLDSPEDLLRLADSIAGKYTVAALPAMRKHRVLPYVLAFLLGGACGAGLLFLLPLLGL
ncbi:MAG: hypothetical protein ACI3XT_01080 [Butyricicoccaceae bacterium]